MKRSGDFLVLGGIGSSIIRKDSILAVHTKPMEKEVAEDVAEVYDHREDMISLDEIERIRL